jgi:hypothetical protein
MIENQICTFLKKELGRVTVTPQGLPDLTVYDLFVHPDEPGKKYDMVLLVFPNPAKEWKMLAKVEAKKPSALLKHLRNWHVSQYLVRNEMKEQIEMKQKQLSYYIEQETKNLFSKMKMITSVLLIPVCTILCLFPDEDKSYWPGEPIYLPAKEFLSPFCLKTTTPLISLPPVLYSCYAPHLTSIVPAVPSTLTYDQEEIKTFYQQVQQNMMSFLRERCHGCQKKKCASICPRCETFQSCSSGAEGTCSHDAEFCKMLCDLKPFEPSRLFRPLTATILRSSSVAPTEEEIRDLLGKERKSRT